jgi:hypothetical protein
MKSKQEPCRCPAIPFPHRPNSKSARHGECTPDTRDEAARHNEADGQKRRLVYHGKVNEL